MRRQEAATPQYRRSCTNEASSMKREEARRRKGRSSSFISKALRYAIYARDGFECTYCERRFVFMEYGISVDHVVSRIMGGTHTATNLVTSCISCNSRRKGRKVCKAHFSERIMR